MYWKEKFCQAQDLIRELNEKSIEFEEIPGLMVTKKVKPNLEKVSTRVTQMHGSMRAKDVAAIVKGIKEVKEKKATSKQDTVNKKQELKELILQCKMKCTCSQRKCLAAGLKECPVCKNVLCSVCGKASCKIDGKKPTMILPAKESGRVPCKKLIFNCSGEEVDSESEDGDEEEIESDDIETGTESDDTDMASESKDEDFSLLTTATEKLYRVWKSITPPANEESIMGKWYALIYQSKQKKILFIGKLLRRFLFYPFSSLMY